MKVHGSKKSLDRISLYTCDGTIFCFLIFVSAERFVNNIISLQIQFHFKFASGGNCGTANRKMYHDEQNLREREPAAYSHIARYSEPGYTRQYVSSVFFFSKQCSDKIENGLNRQSVINWFNFYWNQVFSQRPRCYFFCEKRNSDFRSRWKAKRFEKKLTNKISGYIARCSEICIN